MTLSEWYSGENKNQSDRVLITGICQDWYDKDHTCHPIFDDGFLANELLDVSIALSVFGGCELKRVEDLALSAVTPKHMDYNWALVLIPSDLDFKDILQHKFNKEVCGVERAREFYTRQMRYKPA